MRPSSDEKLSSPCSWEFASEVCCCALGVVFVTVGGDVRQLMGTAAYALDLSGPKLGKHLRPEKPDLAIAGDLDIAQSPCATHPPDGVDRSFQTARDFSLINEGVVGRGENL